MSEIVDVSIPPESAVPGVVDAPSIEKVDAFPMKRQRGRPPTAHLKGTKNARPKRIRRAPSSGESPSSSSKTKTLSTDEIVASVVAKMSVHDPMTIAELCTHIPSATRESVHTVVDILVILGVLIQVRLKDPPKVATPGGGGRGGYHASRLHFALSGFLRSPTPIEDVTALPALVERKIQSIETIQLRNKELMVSQQPLIDMLLYYDWHS